MSEKSQIRLNPTSILHVPLQKYNQNFTFIVNGETFQTSRIIADLLSPQISQIHFSDSTVNKFNITTGQHGHFQYLLDLANFSERVIPENEIPFISEVIKILGNKTIEFYNQKDTTKITINNVFNLIKKHEQNQTIYSKLLQEEVDYASSHFYEFSEKQKEELMTLQIDTIESILSSPKLQLKNEDQLVQVINKLYSNDSYKYTYLYEYVEFSNVAGKTIKEFLEIFDLNDITNEIWKSLSLRLEHEIIKTNQLTTKNNTNNKNGRYNGISIPFNENQVFDGIINYIRKNSINNILDEINITASSSNDSKTTGPQNVVLYEDQSKDFRAVNSGDIWICFDFKSRSIIPSSYTIRSYGFDQYYPHPKSWVIEGSTDKNNWKMIDEQEDCPFLNGKNLIHTFIIQNLNNEKYQYIRMRQTGLNWDNSRQLSFDSIEFYGKLYCDYTS